MMQGTLPEPELEHRPKRVIGIYRFAWCRTCAAQTCHSYQGSYVWKCDTCHTKHTRNVWMSLRKRER